MPIDQLREHTGPTALLVKRIPKEVLETVYGLTIRARIVEEGGDGKITAESLLITYAGKPPMLLGYRDTHCVLSGKRFHSFRSRKPGRGPGSSRNTERLRKRQVAILPSSSQRHGRRVQRRDSEARFEALGRKEESSYHSRYQRSRYIHYPRSSFCDSITRSGTQDTKGRPRIL